MAEKEEVSEAEQAATGKKSSNMALIMIINVVLIGGVLAYLFVFNKPQESSAAPAAPSAAPMPMAHMGEPGPLVRMDNFIVNLADQDANRYLKMGLAVEMLRDEVSDLISKREPMIRDAVISLCSSQSFKQVRTNQGKIDLRENIKKRLGEIVGQGMVRGVYFTEFVVQ